MDNSNLDNNLFNTTDENQDNANQLNTAPNADVIQTGDTPPEFGQSNNENVFTSNDGGGFTQVGNQNDGGGFTQVGNQNDGGGFNTTNFGPNQHSSGSNQSKYKIVDLYWLINPRILAANPKLQKGEAQFVAISYNIIFGNLRISLFDVPNNALIKHVLFYNSLKRLTTGTIYSSSCAELLYNDNHKFVCMEQLFNNTGENWQKERPMCSFQRQNENIRLISQDPINGNFFYDFTNWHAKVLLDSCKFCLNEGSKLTGQYRTFFK